MGDLSQGMVELWEYFPTGQKDRWTFLNRRGDEEKEVTYVIDGREKINGVDVPKRVQEDFPTEYFCTMAGSVYGVRDFKHSIGMTGDYMLYTPPTVVIPARMHVGNVHYNNASLLRYEGDGTFKAFGSFHSSTVLEARETVEVKAGRFDRCARLHIVRDDVFEDVVVTVVFKIWTVEHLGTIKSEAHVTIYSPASPEPFVVDSMEELVSAEVGVKKYPA